MIFYNISGREKGSTPLCLFLVHDNLMIVMQCNFFIIQWFIWLHYFFCRIWFKKVFILKTSRFFKTHVSLEKLLVGQLLFSISLYLIKKMASFFSRSYTFTSSCWIKYFLEGKIRGMIYFSCYQINDVLVVELYHWLTLKVQMYIDWTFMH